MGGAGPGPGRVQTYWGGALPDSHQCACALLGKCLDSRFACNCDANHDQWYCVLQHLSAHKVITNSFVSRHKVYEN